MGTRLNPAMFDCYQKALPDEPMFVLLARDKGAPAVVRQWATRRAQAFNGGSPTLDQLAQIQEAHHCANAMEQWRSDNYGRWFVEKSTPLGFLADIVEFHTKFEQTYDGPPRRLDGDLGYFRVQFMLEEICELMAAWLRKDQVNALDSFVDLAYVMFGTIYLCGYRDVFDEAWRRVHIANMAKRLSTHLGESKRGYFADVVKPDGWVAPDLSDLAK